MKDGDARIKQAKIIKKRLEGKTYPEIQKELRCSPNTVLRALNSQECKEAIERARAKILSLADVAADVVFTAMERKDGDSKEMNNALKAALSVLESAGAISKNFKVEHEYPKPTIIRRLNGEEVRIGVITHDAEFRKDPTE